MPWECECMIVRKYDAFPVSMFTVITVMGFTNNTCAYVDGTLQALTSKVAMRWASAKLNVQEPLFVLYILYM